uniref:Uncharacterized protein n=1 Tax=Arundo donax TaxID=35708 RepID=A0A0A8ZXU9_ARUDO
MAVRENLWKNRKGRENQSLDLHDLYRGGLPPRRSSYW